MQKISVFISYSHEDKPIARDLAKGLSSFGLRVWIDEGEMMIGDSILDRIASAIADTQFVIALISRSSVESRWCQTELSLALTGGLHKKGVKVLPVRIGEVLMPNTLAGTYYLDLDQSPIASVVEKITLAVMRHSAETLVAETMVGAIPDPISTSIDRSQSQDEAPDPSSEVVDPVSSYAEQDVPQQPGTIEGVVEWFNAEKGYGFISPAEGGADVFVHYPAIQISGWRKLSDGQRVRFTIVQDKKGPAAGKVYPL